MFRKAVIGMFIVLVAATTVRAQSPKVEITGIIGWTFPTASAATR